MAGASQQRWAEVERLLDQALDLPPDERRAFLAGACAGDQTLQAEVERLLRASEGAEAFLQEPAPAYAAPFLAHLTKQQMLAPGTRLGRYEVIRELGRGGMATVYLANDLERRRQVAVKVLTHELALAVRTERFLREIEIAARLTHPHILPVHDSGRADGVLYYVTPYIEGDSLRQRLERQGPLSLEDALRIAGEVADALAFAHARGVVHRDIKPANILFQAGHAVVADFGIARAIAAETGTINETGMALGTPAYMSPEQAGGSGVLDGRSDIYSLGCVLYEMLTGSPPFTGPNAQAVLARHLADPVPSLRTVRTVPVGLERAVFKALAKVPADRFATAREFAATLAAPKSGPGWRWGVGSLVAAAVMLIIGWLVSQSAGGLPEASGDFSRMAVLYFEDASRDGSLRWLAKGLTEDLIDALGTVHGLTVTSRNGVRPFEGSAVPPDSIGRRLGVGLLADGVLEPVGRRRDSVRVSLDLVDASTAVLLEHLSLVRSLREPLVLRRDLTGELEQLLRRRIGARVRLRQERLAAGNDVAWQGVRQARELREDAKVLLEDGDERGAAARLHRADSLLAAAERVATDWAQPTIERADLALMEALVSPDPATGDSTLFGRSVTTLLLESVRHAERVLRRWPSDVRAMALHGEVLLRLWNFGAIASKDTLIAAAYRDLTRATELDPDLARAWYALSDAFTFLGRPEESRLAAYKALAKDVYAAQAPAVIANLFFAALNRDARAEADSLCGVGRRFYPENPNFIECELTRLGWFGSGAGSVDSAWDQVRRLDTVSTVSNGRLHRRLLVSAVLARSGLRDSAHNVLASTRALAPSATAWNVLAVYEAYTLALLGERQAAIRALGRLVERNPENRGWLVRHPWFRSLRDDPAFQRIVQAPN